MSDQDTLTAKWYALVTDLGGGRLQAELTREDWGRIEVYGQGRWGMSRIHAHRMIESAAVTTRVLPIGNIPTTESQARPLTRLEPPAAGRGADGHRYNA